MKKVILTLLLIGGLFDARAQRKNVQSKDSIARDIRLDEMVVTGTRASGKTPVAFTNVSKEEIKKLNFGQDMPYLLSLTPSMVITSDAGAGVGYTGLRIRGTDASRINVTTNGIPFNDAESHGTYWVDMPDFASSVEDIQVQRGVGTSTNGAGAFGASVNMKTDNIPMKSFAEFNGTYGSFNTSKETFKLGTGLINNHWAFEGRFSNVHSDGYIDRATSNMQSYFGQGGYFSKNTIMKFITFGGTEHTYHAWNGVPKDSLATHRTYNPSGYMGIDASGNPLYYKNQTDNYTQNHYQLILSHVINPELSLNTALFYIKGKGYYEEYKDSASEADLGKTLKYYGLKTFSNNGQEISMRDRIQQKWLDNDFGGMIFSLNYKKEKLDATFGGGANRYVGYSFGKNMWIKNFPDEDFTPGLEFYRSKGDKYDANIYTKANYEFASGLNAYVDLQYRFIDYTIKGTNDKFNGTALQPLDIHKQFNFFNPKAGLFYQIDKNNQTYASVSIAHREPTRNNFTDAVNSIEPTSERLVDYELGYTYTDKTVTAGANLYFMDYKNQLILNGQINAVGEALTTNIPESYRAGIELMAGAKITDWFKWNGNATFSQNRIKNYTEYVDRYDADWNYITPQYESNLGTTPIAFSPNVTASSIFSADYKHCNLSFMSNYVGKQYIDNTGNDERSLKSYFVNNLRIGRTFTPKGIKELGVSLLINNIFNVKYESNAWVYSYYYDGVRYAMDGYFPQAGANVLANITLKF